MANRRGLQPDFKYCPACKSKLRNVPRGEMRSRGYKRANGVVARHTHTYECKSKGCENRFEINQAR